MKSEYITSDADTREAYKFATEGLTTEKFLKSIAISLVHIAESLDGITAILEDVSVNVGTDSIAYQLEEINRNLHDFQTTGIVTQEV